MIKLVYDLTLSRHIRVNPKTNVKIEEDEEGIPLERILRNKEIKNNNEVKASNNAKRKEGDNETSNFETLLVLCQWKDKIKRTCFK